VIRAVMGVALIVAAGIMPFGGPASKGGAGGSPHRLCLIVDK